jgi:hypothetical protein
MSRSSENGFYWNKLYNQYYETILKIIIAIWYKQWRNQSRNKATIMVQANLFWWQYGKLLEKEYDYAITISGREKIQISIIF